MRSSHLIALLLVFAGCGRLFYSETGGREDSGVGGDGGGDVGLRRAITIDNVGIIEDLIDFPVLLRLDSTFDYGSAAEDGSDLRFYDDGVLIPHEIETWNRGGISSVWFTPPLIAMNQETVVVLDYGAPPADSARPLSEVWRAGYQAVYHFGEDPACPVVRPACMGTADEPKIIDSTSFANHGRPFDGTADNSGTASTFESDDWVPGKVGNAIHFHDDADDLGLSPDLIFVPDSDSLDLPGASLTLATWVVVEDNDVELILLKAIDDYPVYQARYGEWGLSWNQFAGFDEEQMCLWINSEGPNGACSGVGNMPIAPPAPGWHYLTVTLSGDRPSREVRWYLDGAVLNVVVADQPDLSDTTQKPLVIGGPNTNSELFEGLLDELRIANVPRSEAWIAAQYRSQTGAMTSVGEAQPN